MTTTPKKGHGSAPTTFIDCISQAKFKNSQNTAFEGLLDLETDVKKTLFPRHSRENTESI
jgi:hypothetical protein